jgi:hypothetical protein
MAICAARNSAAVCLIARLLEYTAKGKADLRNNERRKETSQESHTTLMRREAIAGGDGREQQDCRYQRQRCGAQAKQYSNHRAEDRDCYQATSLAEAVAISRVAIFV